MAFHQISSHCSEHFLSTMGKFPKFYDKIVRFSLNKTYETYIPFQVTHYFVTDMPTESHPAVTPLKIYILQI